MKHKRVKKLISLLTLIAFTLTQAGILPSQDTAYASPVPPETKIPSREFSLDLPPDLGTIQALHAGAGPTLIHLQTAHGNYEAQKKIQAILHHLQRT
jgi:hypothetical protein